jgi:competence protein ComEA
MRVWGSFAVVVVLAIGLVAWFVPRYGEHEVKNTKWVEQMDALSSQAGFVEPPASKEPIEGVVGTPKVAGKVHLNAATVEELDTLPGIGPSKAALIVAYRKEHGAFATLEELQLVKGIGEKTFEKLAPLMELN